MPDLNLDIFFWTPIANADERQLGSSSANWMIGFRPQHSEALIGEALFGEALFGEALVGEAVPAGTTLRGSAPNGVAGIVKCPRATSPVISQHDGGVHLVYGKKRLQRIFLSVKKLIQHRDLRLSEDCDHKSNS